MLKENNNVQNVIKSATENAEAIIDVNKIVGEPILNQRGQTAIPISKVTVGVLSGGGEYGELRLSKEIGERFAGGALTITSVSPECFLIDNGNGFEIVNANGALDSLMIAISQLINKVKKWNLTN